jgi:hypothetical protein
VTTTASGNHQCQRTAKARFALEALAIEGMKSRKIVVLRTIAGLVAGVRYTARPITWKVCFPIEGQHNSACEISQTAERR